MVRTIFAEMQPFKGVENYFTDSLIYEEDIEPIKKSLADDVDSGNEVDSESEEDASATISIKLIIAYLDDFDCNNPAKNEGDGSLIRILLLITLCILRMYLPMLGPYTCLYQSQKWHACI